jgi:hypothetical protein
MKKYTKTIAVSLLVLVFAFMGCSSDAGLNPQSEMGTDIQAQTTLDLEEQAGGGQAFSRYGIGLDGFFVDDNYSGMDTLGEEASSDSTAGDDGSPD